MARKVWALMADSGTGMDEQYSGIAARRRTKQFSTSASPMS
jgi:hypothetical protein